MAIRVQYTPYAAVGKLAQAGGRAQRATREQAYQKQQEEQARLFAEQKESQARTFVNQQSSQERIITANKESQKVSINANTISQQRGIEANMDLQTQRLDMQSDLQEAELRARELSQEAQVAAQQDSLQAQILSQTRQAQYNRDAQALAAVQQRRVQEQQLEFQREQLEVQKTTQEWREMAEARTFGLQAMGEQRLQQSLMDSTERVRSLDLAGLEALDRSRKTLAENLIDWEGLYSSDGIDQNTYEIGKMQIQQGKIPTIPKPTTNFTPYQLFQMDWKEEQAGVKREQPYSDREMDNIDKTVRDISAITGPIETLFDESEKELLDRYKQFQVRIGYDTLGQTKKDQADSSWDGHLFGHGEDNWDINSKTVKKLRTAPATTTTQQKSKTGGRTATEQDILDLTRQRRREG